MAWFKILTSTDSQLVLEADEIDNLAEAVGEVKKTGVFSGRDVLGRPCAVFGIHIVAIEPDSRKVADEPLKATK